MRISSHAKARMQQRGFDEELVELILTYGSRERKPGGVFEYRLTRKDKAKLEMKLKRILQSLDRVSKKAVLVASTGTVITVYNR